MSQAGFSSLRTAEKLIDDRRVLVNGVRVDTKGMKVVPHRDLIEVDGKAVCVPSMRELSWILYCKPPGVSLLEANSKHTTEDAIPEIRGKGFIPISALARRYSGLEILTNHRFWIHRLCHPSFGHYSSYLICADGRLKSNCFDPALNGAYNASNFEIFSAEYSSRYKNTRIEIGLRELSPRNIEEMFVKLNINIVSLRRLSIGTISLKGTKANKWHVLKSNEIEGLKRMSARLQDANKIHGQ
jgi:23S rRNA pseudouridine2605 synthase